MMQELVVSVISGVIVAIILQIFGRGGKSRMQETVVVRHVAAPPKRRGSFFGGLLRFIFSVVGGIALAFVTAQSLHLRNYHRHFDSTDGISAHAPLLGLTIVGTIIIWLLLSAMTRR